ncbi:MAG: [Fe-Fe] hydrogenase large subunit C-terminal domain-containing protein [Candidatus Cloacimonetes bacterium]|jgi:iron only hydrogenase large subunit-like protein|nr:4Fe-4S binding protein [Candidatus Cloacimonadota bacterium]MDY0299005.1 [Fe-Fe] hydrogenase large subunit C-terminal domain-containing protein [Candidatus Cloacimonadaceae bacterium]MCK9332376.1 4Fe-4S binding protein [Candidatus Cloacimonadota bacterium]MDD2210065.1 [Fe-Fe] hydrogenase large subunit C-terminal domain-containing protein [Candidatus Cloacimonadota bacterium]MDD4232000.1 [Fe-Fe] hydrogenase large subunit C-terminal domain-containing protein [Candidatus Cloacimonadota bacteriu
MNNPIYTEKTQCQDCYKCVRACPVKAIRVVDGSAQVMPEACILCGRCTEVCPVGAKKIRDDLGLAMQLLDDKKQVYVSLAPSFRTEFNGMNEAKLIGAIRGLGFTGVSETALGAQVVSSACAQLLREGNSQLMISSACPSVIHLIEQYYPHLVPYVTPVASPLQAHCKLLRKEFGQDIGIVFIGPCIAKKNESTDSFDVALTFADLRRWFNLNVIDWDKVSLDDSFVPKAAEEGGLYPIDSGMSEGIKYYGAPKDTLFMSFSGIEQIMEAFDEIDIRSFDHPVFVETLACVGGCVNGPGVSIRGSIAQKRYKVQTLTPPAPLKREIKPLNIVKDFHERGIKKGIHSKQEIAAALLRIGKKRLEDELNCGGCGYDTCKEFACALIEEKAEPAMCVSYLRKLAQNKAAALIKAMPSGVVIVDENLKIIESNDRFIQIIGGDASIVSEADPDLEGAYLERLIDFHDLFAKALKEGTEVRVTDIRKDNRILRLTLFSIQKHLVLGGILQDITEPVIQREQIIEKANEVMRKNLTTVQKIAFLLGENAADSEVLLSSIIQSFTNKDS